MELQRNGPETGGGRAQLGLWDAVSIIVGIVIGAGIFESPPRIFGNVSGPVMGLAVWVVGGLLALVGALCYAELTTTYPRLGGDYVYLSRAYAPWVGFFFGWAQLAVILTGSIGSMAYVFADYAVKLSPEDFKGWEAAFAAVPVVVLSVMNLLGVVLGKRTQNLLSAAKVLGLIGIVVAGFAWGRGDPFPSEFTANKAPSLGLAMIFVLYTYGGWNDAAFVAAEVRNRRRNMPLALVLGTLTITLIYVAINLAFLWGLGFDKARESNAVAADVLKLGLGDFGSRAMSIIVMISALGAVNGLIFTGARVYSTLGADYSLLGWLGRWHPRLGSPFWALVTQAVISLAWIYAVGTQSGREGIDHLLGQAGLEPVPWNEYFGGFSTLVTSTAPVFWLFFELTGFSLFILRARDAGIERPFSVPLYPLLPFIFCNMCAYMLIKATEYAGKLILIPVVLMLAGLPVYLLSGKRPVASEPLASEPGT